MQPVLPEPRSPAPYHPVQDLNEAVHADQAADVEEAQEVALPQASVVVGRDSSDHNQLPVAYTDAATPQMVSVTCPSGSCGGDTIHMQVPDTTQMFEIKVPPGVHEGQEFYAKIPGTSVASSIPIAAAQPVANRMTAHAHYQEHHDGIAGEMTDQELRLFPVYQLGRVVKSMALIDIFLILLWALWRDSRLLFLAPFGFTGFYAGYKYNRHSSLAYLCFGIASIAVFAVDIARETLPFIAITNIILTFWAMRVNLRFSHGLIGLSPQDLQLLRADESVLSNRATRTLTAREAAREHDRLYNDSI